MSAKNASTGRCVAFIEQIRLHVSCGVSGTLKAREIMSDNMIILSHSWFRVVLKMAGVSGITGIGRERD
jgi:hypothetical protein